MDKEQEATLTLRIKEEMQRVRNDALASGMRAALGVVLNMCNEKKSETRKVKEIREFCEKGLKKKG